MKILRLLLAPLLIQTALALDTTPSIANTPLTNQTTPTSEDAAKKLADESLAKLAETAKEKPSQASIEAKITRAVALIEKEGPACFSKFGGKNSEFLDHGTFIFILNTEGLMLYHPVLYKMVGNNMLELRDKKGNPLIAPIIQLVKTKEKGWYNYWWPQPGNTKPELKWTFVHKATYDNMTYVVACGAYDITVSQK